MFSQFCNLHAYSILLAYPGSMLYAIPSLFDIYTIDAHSIHFQFWNLIAFPSFLEQCYILIQYLFVIYSSTSDLRCNALYTVNNFLVFLSIACSSLFLQLTNAAEYLNRDTLTPRTKFPPLSFDFKTFLTF